MSIQQIQSDVSRCDGVASLRENPDDCQSVDAITPRLRVVAPDQPAKKPGLPQESIVFQSQIMQQLVNQALSYSQSQATVLITGESGTGKNCLPGSFMIQANEVHSAMFELTARRSAKV